MKRPIRQRILVLLTVATVLLISFAFSTQVLGLSYTSFSWLTYADAYGYQLYDLDMYLNDTYVRGDVSAGDIPVTVRLTRGSTTLSETTVDADAYGNFKAFFDTVILGGDVIEVDLPSTSTIAVDVAPLSAEVDKAADLVTGTGVANSSLRVWVWSWPAGGETLYPTANSAGEFTADFGGLLDIFLGAYVDVEYSDANGYETLLYDLRAPGVAIDLYYGDVWGYADPGATVDLTLKDSTGVVKATAQEIADEDGYFWSYFYNPARVPIEIGDRVEMSYPGAATQSATAEHVAITSIDPATDIIQGTAPPNSQVEIYVDDDYQGHYETFLVTADGSGTFTADLSGAQQLLGLSSSGDDRVEAPGGDPSVKTTDLGGPMAPTEEEPMSQQPPRDAPREVEWELAPPRDLADESEVETSSTAMDVTAAEVTFDILPGTWASATYHDNADNEVHDLGRYAGPFAKAWMNYWDDLFIVGEPGASVDVTVRNALGAIRGTGSSTLAATGAGYVDLWDSAGDAVDLQDGDVVEVVVGDGSSHTINVVRLDYTIDREASTVWGTGPANTNLRLVYDGYDAVNVTTGAGGDFSYTYSRTFYGWNYFDTYYRASDTQAVAVRQTVPVFTVQPQWDSLSGYGAPNQAVVGTLKDGLGNVKATDNTVSDYRGYYYLNFSGDIAFGDTMVVDVGSLHYEQEVVTLTVAADTTSNVVYGTAPSTGDLWVYRSHYFGPYEYYDGEWRSADTSGNYAVAFGQVRGGDYLSVEYEEAGYKDRVRIYGYAPYLYMDHARDWIGGVTTASAAGTITVRDSGGGLKISENVTARDSYGSFGKEVGVDLVPGDRVAVAIGDLNLTKTVIPMTGTLDLANDTLSGTSLANERIGVGAYHWTGNYYSSYSSGGYLRGFVDTNAAGDFSFDFGSLADLITGDYGGIYYIDDADDTHYQVTLYTTDPTISVKDYPATVEPNAPVPITVNVANGAHVQSLGVRWDTKSHGDATDYPQSTYLSAQNRAIGDNTITVYAPSGGKIYFKAYAYVDGRSLWSGEYVVEVEESTLNTIYDPVSSTTNDDTPSINGVSAPNATVKVYQADAVVRSAASASYTLLGTTTTDDVGYWTFEVTTPLTPGIYNIKAVTEIGGTTGPDSNIVRLKVDPSLPVDPAQIVAKSGGQSQRPRDSEGYADLDGRIWTRTGEAVEIEVPFGSTDVYSAELYIDGEPAITLIDSGDNLYVGAIEPPVSGEYDVDLQYKSGGSGGDVSSVDLVTGVVDPDGYIYNAVEGADKRVSGVVVTCYELIDAENDVWRLWNASLYDQTNPQTSSSAGYYGFYPPSGTYKLQVSAPGYWDFESPEIVVDAEPLHYNVALSPVFEVILPIVIK